jgi:hypothetical protein
MYVCMYEVVCKYLHNDEHALRMLVGQVCMYVYMYVCMYVCMYEVVCKYLHDDEHALRMLVGQVCMYVYMYVCMYACMKLYASP